MRGGSVGAPYRTVKAATDDAASVIGVYIDGLLRAAKHKIALPERINLVLQSSLATDIPSPSRRVTVGVSIYTVCGVLITTGPLL